MDNDLISKAESYVRHYCRAHFEERLLYHNLFHIQQVVDYVAEIAPMEGLSNKQKEMATVAAWFHDIGVCLDYDNHEQASSTIAADFLKEQNYPKEDTACVQSAIMATKIRNLPNGIVEEVLRDADSLHLGKLDFFVRTMALREEMRLRLGEEVTEQEILKSSIIFYRDHHYYTNYAREKYKEAKSANLNRLEAMYHKYFGDIPDASESKST